MKSGGQNLHRLATTQCLPHFFLTSCEGLRITLAPFGLGLAQRRISTLGRVMYSEDNILGRCLPRKKDGAYLHTGCTAEMVSQDDDPHRWLLCPEAREVRKLDSAWLSENDDIGLVLPDRALKLHIAEIVLDDLQVPLQAQDMHQAEANQRIEPA